MEELRDVASLAESRTVSAGRTVASFCDPVRLWWQRRCGPSRSPEFQTQDEESP